MSDVRESGPAPPDPMRMREQPALQTSEGRIWVVMGGLVAAASLVPLVMLIASRAASHVAAWTTAAIVVLLYVLLVVLRITISRRRLRLRWLAACMLAIAGAALVGVWICALIEGGAVSRSM